MTDERVITPAPEQWRRESEKIDRALKSGGGGGTFDGMDARVTSLEKDMTKIKTDMKDVRERMARMEGEISRLPGYPGIATIVALVGGGLLIVSRLFPDGSPLP